MKTSTFRVPAAASLSICTDPSQAPPRYVPRYLTAIQIPNIQASSCYDPDDMVTIAVQYENKNEHHKIFRGLLVWHSYFATLLNPKSEFYEGTNDRYEISAHHAVFEAF